MKNEKRKFGFTSGIIVGIMIGGATIVCANQAIQAIQNTEIKVSLNGQIQEFKDETTGEVQYPITYQDRTYLPLRNVAQLTGLNVDYDSQSNTAILNTETNDETEYTKLSPLSKEEMIQKKLDKIDDEGEFFEYNNYFLHRTSKEYGSLVNLIVYDNNLKQIDIFGTDSCYDLFLDKNGQLIFYNNTRINNVNFLEPENEVDQYLKAKFTLEFKDGFVKQKLLSISMDDIIGPAGQS